MFNSQFEKILLHHLRLTFYDLDASTLEKEWLWRPGSLFLSVQEKKRNCKWSYPTPNTSLHLRSTFSPSSHGKLGKLGREEDPPNTPNEMT